MTNTPSHIPNQLRKEIILRKQIFQSRKELPLGYNNIHPKLYIVYILFSKHDFYI